ncbi:MAG TPA: hypothetical protein VGC42_05345 [Kofleriaceae bacterium]
MRGSRGIIFGALVLASPAWADHTSLHFTATGDASATDNLFATNNDRQPDVFVTVRPGVLYAYDAPRMIHDFTGELEAIEYLAHSDNPSLSGRGGWRAVILPGPRSSVTMSIDAGTGVVTSLANRTSADETVALAAPSGNVETQQVSVSESTSYQTSEHTRLTQGALGRYATTDDNAGSTTDTREISGNLGFERQFQHDSLLLNATVSYLLLSRDAPAGTPFGTGRDHQLNPGGSLAWHHDWNQRWSHAANAGISVVHPVGNDPNDPTATRKTSLFWVAGAGLAYTEVWGRAYFSVDRSVAPNLLLAENTLDENVNLQVSMPLPFLDDTKRNPKLVGQASIGYSHSELINSDSGDTEGNINVGHLDLSVGYTPRPGQTFGVRYEFVYQRSGEPIVMPGSIAVAAFPTYFRNTLSFTFSLRVPDRVAGEVPRRNKSIRSDRSDLVPVGSEPVVTDPLEGGEGDQGNGDR